MPSPAMPVPRRWWCAVVFVGVFWANDALPAHQPAQNELLRVSNGGNIPVDTIQTYLEAARTPRPPLSVASGSLSPSTGERLLEYTASSLWNDVYHVSVRGHYAYCIMSWGILTLDVTNPTAPTKVDQYFLNTWPKWNAGAEIVDHYLLVAYGVSGLFVFDLTYGSHPRLVATLDTPGQCGDLTVAGSTAVVSDAGAGMLFVDVTDPTALEVKTTYPDLHNVKEVAVTGDYAFVANDSSFMSLNIQDAFNIVRLDSMETWYGLVGVTVKGTRAYLAFIDRLLIVDISDPANLSLVGQAHGLYAASRTHFYNDFALVANSSAGLAVVDVSQPATAKIVFQLATAGGVPDFEIQDTLAYVADGSGGCQIVDVARAPELALIGSYVTAQNVADVEIVGELAYVANETDGFRILDVSNRFAPTTVGTLSLPGHAWRMATQGDLAYVVSRSTGGLYVIDCSHPDSPVLLGQHFRPELTWDVCVEGTIAYILTNTGLLEIVDVSDPRNPRLVNSVTLVAQGFTLAVRGQNLFVGELDSLATFDITNPGDPVLLRTLPVNRRPYEMQIHDSLLYIANQHSGLVIVDISDPSNPIKVGATGTLGGEARDVAVDGNIAYVANGAAGVVAVNVSDPQNPFTADHFQVGGLGSGIDASNGNIMAAMWYGLMTFTKYEQPFQRGDANGDGSIAMADIIYLINYVFREGPGPIQMPEGGDMDCSGTITVGDMIVLIDHVFKSGPAQVCR